MNIIRISNHSAGAVARSYALTPNNLVVWLELAPQHPKIVGAIWASLVDGGGEWLRIQDEDPDRTHEPVRSFHARGLHRRYHRLAVDVPQLAGRARPKFLRLVAPDLCEIENSQQPFGVLAWPGPSTGDTPAGSPPLRMTPGTALAAMLEHDTPYPMRIGWGDYLLAEALNRGHAQPLITGGPAPEGYWIEPAPWEAIISEGVREGHITLEGDIARLPVSVSTPVYETA